MSKATKVMKALANVPEGVKITGTFVILIGLDNGDNVTLNSADDKPLTRKIIKTLHKGGFFEDPIVFERTELERGVEYGLIAETEASHRQNDDDNDDDTFCL